MNANEKNLRPTWSDPDDAPEITDDWIAEADLYVGKRLMRRGRPIGSNKESTTVRFDCDVLAAFKAGGPGWQTRMNAALRDWLKGRSMA
jgi:uncharacterized protein (DUF4415 family)